MTATTPAIAARPPTLFSDICFSPESHVYVHAPSATPLISVTTVLRSIKPPFDRDAISARTAAKRGVSQAEILAEWELASSNALANGSAVHAYAEEILLDRDTPSLAVVELGNDHLPEVAGFRRAWEKMKTEFGAEVVATEQIIGDLSLGVAGTVDCIAALVLPCEYNGRIRRRHVFDWKTGKRFNASNNFGEKLLPPFDYLDNCELNLYSLQTSIYRLILERNGCEDGSLPPLDYGDSFLVHLSSDGGHRFYRGIDLRREVEEWLKWRLF